MKAIKTIKPILLSLSLLTATSFSLSASAKIDLDKAISPTVIQQGKSEVKTVYQRKDFTTSDLVNYAGMQRMLSHRLLVTYAQIGQVQSYGNPITSRDAVFAKFNDNLDKLSTDDRFLPTIITMRALAKELYQKSVNGPKKEDFNALIEVVNNLVYHANEIIGVLVNTDSKATSVVNVSGQLRMLSQRMALFLLGKNWNDGHDYTADLGKTLGRFSGNISVLRKYEYNTIDTKKKLNSMVKDYNKLNRIIARTNNDLDHSFEYARLTMQILRKAKQVVNMYVDIAEKHE